ncbi:hypothetical protein [Leptolyngbya sp. 7M]|uniref:hypothetical protein n=1 Tax=Leptolyngbya sp. 7M TaxID=2812896 RepID=UPI001B8B7CE4|nr:hypothetical protein [Leptolyngbya sp. 7M]QYO62564.1 hypothetical protein JVX88_21190 [Leptolyngbya sp. 7M]
MEIDEFTKSAQQVDLNAKGAIGDLDTILHKIEFQQLTIDDLKSLFSHNVFLFQIIVGLWAFGFTRSPRFIDGALIGYNDKLIGQEEQVLISRGLLAIIKVCRIEDASDGDAIDYHYDACGRLFRLNRATAEQLLVDELNQSQDMLISMRLMEALGVLVSHQNQGFLSEATVCTLERIATQSQNFELREFAKLVLFRDVARVNEYTRFLNRSFNLEN